MIILETQTLTTNKIFISSLNTLRNYQPLVTVQCSFLETHTLTKKCLKHRGSLDVLYKNFI